MNKDIALTKGSIRKMMDKFSDSGYPPVVQILDRKMSRHLSTTTYKIFISDGELGMFVQTSVQFNKQNSTGELSILTVIRIDEYSNEICTDECFVVHLTILVNGREMEKVIGEPTNLPTDLNDWLKLFTIKLEKEKKMKKKADSFKLNCLNPSTKISKLTNGCLEKICFKEFVDKPILQILSMVKIINAEENLIYYSLHLSDGRSCFNRVFTQSFHFNNLVEAGIITQYSIIRLDRYKLFEFNTRIRIHNLTVMNKGSDVLKKIGKTVPIKLPGIHDIMIDKLKIDENPIMVERLKNLKAQNVVTLACLSDIQREVPYTKPVLQILITNRYGTINGVNISDGIFAISTEILNDDVAKKILNEPEHMNAVIQVDEYEISFVKETFEVYKPVFHLINFTFIVSSNLNEQIGKPMRNETSKSMLTDEFPDYVFEDIEEEESEQPAITAAEKPVFNKGFLNNVSIFEEPSEVESSNMARKQQILNEKFHQLTLQIDKHNITKSDLIINKTLKNKNILLKKKLFKFSKTMLKDSQRLLRENFEIVGVESQPNENLKNIVKKVVQLISVNLDIENDFVSITRCGKTRNILVKCRNVEIKKQVIAAKRGKELSSEQLNLNIRKAVVIINEQLTPFNKVLLMNAKCLKADKVFDHAWVKNGNVYVRSTTENDNKCIHIYSMDQIYFYGNKNICQ